MNLYSDKTPQSLRAHADGLDREAEAVLREANGHADELRRRARDYRQTAKMLDELARPAACRNCSQPIVPFELGFAHTTPSTCDAAEPMDQTIVDPVGALVAPIPGATDTAQMPAIELTNEEAS